MNGRIPPTRARIFRKPGIFGGIAFPQCSWRGRVSGLLSAGKGFFRRAKGLGSLDKTGGGKGILRRVRRRVEIESRRGPPRKSKHPPRLNSSGETFRKTLEAWFLALSVFFDISSFLTIRQTASTSLIPSDRERIDRDAGGFRSFFGSPRSRRVSARRRRRIQTAKFGSRRHRVDSNRRERPLAASHVVDNRSIETRANQVARPGERSRRETTRCPSARN